MKYLEGILTNTTSFYVFLGILNLFVFFGISALVGMAFDLSEIQQSKSDIRTTIARGKEAIASLDKEVSKIGKELNIVEKEIRSVEGKQLTLEHIMGLQVWGSKEAVIFCKSLEKENPGFKCPDFPAKKK